MTALIGFLLFVIGAAIGLRFADCDLWLRWYPLLWHRSLLTHGLLVPLLLFLAFKPKGRETKEHLPARLFAMGFCLASAVHLAFDLFPRTWSGPALIHLPFVGWSNPAFSQAWIVISLLVCLFLACRLLRNRREFVLAALGLIVTFGVSASAEPRPSFYALATLVPSSFVAFVLPRRAPTDRDRSEGL